LLSKYAGVVEGGGEADAVVYVHEFRLEMVLTSLLLHVVCLETFVEQSNAQSHVDTHALLIDLTCDTILNQDIRRVRAKFVATVCDLVHNLGVPLPLSLARRDEPSHDDVVDLSPILASTGRDVSNDIGIRFLIESRLVADRTLPYLNNMLLAVGVGQVIMGV
jgi:hypothetical protein